MTNSNNDHHNDTNNAGATNQPQQQHRQSNEEEQRQHQQQKCTIRKLYSCLGICEYCRGQRASLVSREPIFSTKLNVIEISSHLPAQLYSKLIDRGWTRVGGHIIFKTDSWDSCCPALAMRLPVAEFQPTKSQRRVLRKMQRLLRGEGDRATISASTKLPRKAAQNKQSYGDEIPILTYLADCTRLALQDILTHTAIQQPIRYKTSSTTNNTITAVSTICAAVAGPSKGKYNRGVLATLVVDYLNVNLKLNNSVFRLQAHEPSGQIICKLSTRHLPVNHNEEQNVVVPTSPHEDLLDGWFRTHMPQSTIQRPYRLTMTTHSPVVSSLQPEVHQLYLDYQQKVHHEASPLSGPDEADWGDAPPEYIEQAHNMLQRTYSNLTPDEMLKMVSSFAYFYRCFVATSLQPFVENNHHPKTGTFHQHYRINGILIAVGVVDIFTEGLSSLYAFYHADFAHSLCPLGKFLVLKEIEYCRALNLRYYYLGDYVHSCPKFRYKAEFHPSQLLCPITFSWIDAQEGQATLDKESPERQCCRLYHGPVAEDFSDELLNKLAVMESISIEVGLSNPVTMSMLSSEDQDIVLPMLEEFVDRVGPVVSRQCVLKLF